MFRKWISLAISLALMLVVGSVFAASSASFTFDFVSDPGDAADGPDFDVVGTGLVDDTATSCDAVVMLMADATGQMTDVDSFCLSTITGLGGSDGDYGSVNSGYVPVVSPVTYALFDLTAADLAALSGFGDSDPEYAAYVLANSTCLSEQFLPVSGLATGTPYSLCAGGPLVSAPAGCQLTVPAGSVVGEAPYGGQVYWEPGKASPGVILNAGTYIVLGQDESQSFYKIMLACQFVWVEKTAMQPSWQPPQNGTPLPTTIVS